MKILCTDSSKLQLIYENQEHLIHLKLIITLDDISKDDENCVKKLKFKVITFDTLIKMVLLSSSSTNTKCPILLDPHPKTWQPLYILQVINY